jgi:hypothetical protein
MVLNKCSQKRGILTVGFDRVDHVVQVADTAACRLKGSQERVVSSYIVSYEKFRELFFFISAVGFAHVG